MNTSRKAPVISFLVAGALAITACGGSDAASDADPCDVAAEVEDAFQAGQDAESAQDALDAGSNFASKLDELAKVASDDIKADVELLADGMRQVADSDPDVGPSEEVQAFVNSDEFDAAGARVGDYLLDTCDIDIDG